MSAIGMVEGHVNRLKLIKRMAELPLLRQEAS